MLEIFIKKSSKFLAVLLTATLAFTQFSYATITCVKNGTVYTYSSDNAEDSMHTTTMLEPGYSGVKFPTKDTDITSLNVNGTVSSPNMSKWTNDATINIPLTDIVLTKINLTNISGNSITAKSMTMDADSVIATNAGALEIADGISNNGGTIMFVGGINSNAITGTGTTVIDGNVISNASIANSMLVNSGNSLTISAGNICGAVSNAGTLNLGAGTLAKAITGTGNIVTKDNVSTDADNLGNTVANDYNLTLTDTGTITKAITGTGTTTIDGDVISNASIANAITVNSGKSLTSNADYIDGAVTNSGTVNLTAGTLEQTITGGTTVIDGTVSSSVSIASAITINSEKSLFIGAGNVGGAVDNSGDLQLATGTLSQQVSGSGTITTMGNVTTDADNLGNTVTNNYDFTLTAGTLAKAITGTGTTVIDGTVVSNESIANSIKLNNTTDTLTIGADNVDGTVTNAGTLNLGAGTLEQAITGTGTTIIVTDVTSNASIANNIKLNTALDLLTISADNIDGETTNAGTIRLGAGTLEQNVLGDGNIITTDNVSVKNSTIENTISNEYELTLQDSTNIKGDISGTSGELFVEASAQDKEITNSADISQYYIGVKKGIFNNTGTIESVDASLTIDENGTLKSNAENITSYNNEILNDGNLTFTGGNNTNDVIGNGKVTINGSIENQNGVVISQKELTVDNAFTNNGTISVEKINGTDTLTNNGDLNLNLKEADSYTLTNLTGTGDTNITVNTVDVTIDNTEKIIKQDTITTYGDKTLTLTGTGKVEADVINYMTGDCLDVATTIDGTLENYAITNIKTNGAVTGKITNTGSASDDAKLNILASTYDVQAGITGDSKSVSNNLLNIGDVSNQAIVTSQTKIENQTITVSSGSLTLSGAGKISNSNLTIEEDGSVFANAEKLDIINNKIINDGELVLVGTNVINENKIVNSTDDVSKGKVIFGDGTSNSIINKADIKQNEVDVLTGTKVTNNNILILEKLDVAGELINNNNNSNAIIVSGADGIAVSGTFTTNASAIETTKIANTGTLNYTGGTNKTAVEGAGTLNVSGDLINNNAIAQKIVNVGQDITVTNNNAITTEALNIGAGSTFTTDITNISKSATEGSAITNTGNLVINADGTNKNTIAGTGTTQITNGATVVNTNGVSVAQKNLVIDNEATLEAAAKDLTATLTNNGILKFNQAGGADTLSSDVKGNGVMNILNNTSLEVKNTATVNQKSIAVASGSSLTSDINNVVATDAITNAGTVTLTGNGENKNVITGEGTLNFGDGSTGTIINEKTITQKIVNVASDQVLTNTGEITALDKITNAGTITTSAILLETVNGIENNGLINFKNLKNDGKNTNVITGTGTIDAIEGSLVNSAAVKQTTINLKSNEFMNLAGNTVEVTDFNVNFTSSLTALATDIKATKINNAGTVTFVGGTNNSEITGTGKLVTTATLTNNAKITQKEVDINAGIFTNTAEKTITAQNINVASGATLKGKATDLVTLGAINNEGILQFNINGADTLSSNVKGNGVMFIGSGLGAGTNLTVNNAIVNQKSIAIDDKSSLISDASSIITTNGIDNAGKIIFTDGINKNNIIGTGALDITGSVINGKDTTINQKNINITTGNKLVLNNVNNVTATNKITNDGTLTIATTDGINNNVIDQTTEGTLNINANVLNNASITQNKINVAEGKVFKTSATNLAATSDNAKINLKGSDTVLIIAEDTITKLEEKVTGKGSIVKKGTGSIKLSNTANDYEGTTTINEGSISIETANNISENTIYMDGGELITTGDMTLANVITATENNDTKIAVGSGKTLKLTGNINETTTKSNFEKDSDGTIELLMETNDYTGDTIINAGRVIGTTKNIKNAVEGLADGTVEFTDKADAVDPKRTVVLNEIVGINLFEKTGNVIMDVVKDFKANTANIKAGTLIINNDIAQSNEEIICSGSKFEVGTMTFTDSVLKGYADIKGNLVMDKNSILAPGNSVGEIKVSGNLALNKDSVYNVEFTQFDTSKANADTDKLANDKTSIAGTGNIESGAKLVLENNGGKYYVKETYSLIEAKGGLTGNYVASDVTFIDSESSDLRPGFETRIDYSLENDGNNLLLTAQRKGTDYEHATDFTRSHNQDEVARAIDNISTGFGGDIVNVLYKLEQYYYYNSTYDTAALKEALNDMSGMIYANTSWLTVINSKAEHIFDKIGDRSRTLDLFPCSKIHDRVWGEYYYNNFHADANSDSRKFDTQTNGFLVGFDVLTLNSWTIGVTAGYGESDLNQAKSDTSKMKDINLGFYGGYEGKNWVLKGMLLGGYEMYDTTRNIGFMNRQATSGHDGYTGTLELEAGYKIALNPKTKKEHKLFLKPFAGLNGNYTTQNGFNEKGADSLNLSVDQHEAFTAQAKVGVGVNGKAKAFEWYVDGFANKILTDCYMESTVSLIDFPGETGMRIKSADMSSMTIGARLGGDYNFNKNWKIFANLLASRSDTTRNYYGNIGVSYKFNCLTNKNEEFDTNDKEINELKKEIQRLRRDVDNASKKLNVVSEQEANKMKTKTVKQFKLESKPTFVFDSSNLTQEGIDSLAEVAKEINNYKDCEVLVEGHTDSFGTDEYNQKLSEQRAESIAKALKDKYDVKNKISIIGKGKKEPMTSNKTQEGRYKNRRVEITIVTTQN